LVLYKILKDSRPSEGMSDAEAGLLGGASIIPSQWIATPAHYRPNPHIAQRGDTRRLSFFCALDSDMPLRPKRAGKRATGA